MFILKSQLNLTQVDMFQFELMKMLVFLDQLANNNLTAELEDNDLSYHIYLIYITNNKNSS